MRYNSAIWLFLAGVFGFTTLGLRNISETTVTFDEFAHLPAGVSYLQTGRFGIYRESPPFVRCITAFPAWLAGARINLTQAYRGYRSETLVGRDFVHTTGKRYSMYLNLGRYSVLVLSIACASIIYWWSRKLFGTFAALAS
jgi:hypothetical protein